MNIKKWAAVFGVCFLMFLIVGGVLLKIGLDRKAYYELPDRGIPRINIELNGVSLEEINGESKDIKYGGNELKIYDEGRIVGYEDVEVKGRGNGTWVQEKKPYQIKFKDRVDLFGMGSARKWYLLANATDVTNLRTVAAFYLEDMLDMRYRFEGGFVELYIDDGYEGLYYLTHAVEIDKNVVDLKDSMGILVELDNVYGGWEKNYRTGEGDLLTIKDLVVDNNSELAMADFLRAYNELEDAVNRKDYEDLQTVADIKSFAEYYLLSEFTVNPDAYWTSFYMYKDGLDDKIHAGPGWDFDLTFGNRSWGNWMGEKFYSPTETMVRKGEFLSKEMYEEMGLISNDMNWYEWGQQLSKIIFNMMEVPEFREEVSKIFVERMSGREEELVGEIYRVAERIYEAAKTNEEKWRGGDFEAELESLVDWVKKRYEYFEEEYGDGVNKKVMLL